MPGRNELSNVNDAFGKRNAVQQRILDKAVERGDNRQFLQTNEKVFNTKPVLQNTAMESIGITGGTFDNIKPQQPESSKLQQASRRESERAAAEVAKLPDLPTPQPAPVFPKDADAKSGAAASNRSGAISKKSDAPKESNRSAAQKLDGFIQK